MILNTQEQIKKVNGYNEKSFDTKFDDKAVIKLDSPILDDDDSLALLQFYLNKYNNNPVYYSGVEDVLTLLMSPQRQSEIKQLADAVLIRETKDMTDDEFTNMAIGCSVIRQSGLVLCVLFISVI